MIFICLKWRNFYLFIYVLIFIAHTSYKQNGTAITLITIQLFTTVYYLQLFII